MVERGRVIVFTVVKPRQSARLNYEIVTNILEEVSAVIIIDITIVVFGYRPCLTCRLRPTLGSGLEPTFRSRYKELSSTTSNLLAGFRTQD